MSDWGQSTPASIVFRSPNPNNKGIFVLHRSFFVIEGVNFPRAGRCDNLTYTGVSPTYGTPYQNESVTIGGRTLSFAVNDPNTENGMYWTQFLEVPGVFCFTYTEPVFWDKDGNMIQDTSIENGNNPAALWYGKSLIELFKIMREWSFLVEEPFNLDHPMATYSKMVFDTLKPTKAILAEIDSLPDMHLARFLKGDENHRQRIEDFPQMSDSMVAWFKKKMEQYPKTTTREKLKNLVI